MFFFLSMYIFLNCNMWTVIIIHKITCISKNQLTMFPFIQSIWCNNIYFFKFIKTFTVMFALYILFIFGLWYFVGASVISSVLYLWLLLKRILMLWKQQTLLRILQTEIETQKSYQLSLISSGHSPEHIIIQVIYQASVQSYDINIFIPTNILNQ